MMRYFDDLETYRIKAGLNRTKLSGIAGVGRNFITQLEAHKPGRAEKVADVFHALKEVLYSKTGDSIEHDSCVTENSRFGKNNGIEDE